MLWVFRAMLANDETASLPWCHWLAKRGQPVTALHTFQAALRCGGNIFTQSLCLCRPGWRKLNYETLHPCLHFTVV